MQTFWRYYNASTAIYTVACTTCHTASNHTIPRAELLAGKQFLCRICGNVYMVRGMVEKAVDQTPVERRSE
jgi:hypothetical protein